MKNKEELARLYSEGSKELYNCLLGLWDNGFETLGCCKGHDDEKNNHRQYIALKKNDNDKIIKLLTLLDKKDIIISFLNDHVSIKKNNDIDIYNNILNALDNYKTSNTINLDKDIIDIINFIDNNDYNYVNIHLYYDNQNIKKYINTSDMKLINELKDKYEYKVLNNKLPMYHFIIKDK